MTDTGSFYNGTGKGRQTWQEVLAYYETYLNKAEAYKQATLTAEYTAMCFPFSVLAKTWKAAQADAPPPPPPPQDTTLLDNTVCESYGDTRLRSDGLTQADGFFVSDCGGIVIPYHDIEGEPVTYITPRFRQLFENRKSNAADIEPRTIYERLRLAPENVTGKNKYRSPSKDETGGIGTLTFFPLQVRQAYKAAQRIPVITATEGEIKAAVCSKHYGIPTISFSGNTV
ncbi:MAG TPA: hypothetical protein PK673_08215, partial [Paludibacteraceae bacterium]|nr:hypothetical protein [Paludibacteraceae bacterium]